MVQQNDLYSSDPSDSVVNIDAFRKKKLTAEQAFRRRFNVNAVDVVRAKDDGEVEPLRGTYADAKRTQSKTKNANNNHKPNIDPNEDPYGDQPSDVSPDW